MIEISAPYDIDKYYNKDKHGYIFNDDVTIKCDLNVGTRNIYSENIKANNLTAHEIWCNDLEVRSLKADSIYCRDIFCTENIKIKKTFSANNCICEYLDSNFARLNKLGATGVKATILTCNEFIGNDLFVSRLTINKNIHAHTIGKKSQANFKIF